MFKYLILAVLLVSAMTVNVKHQNRSNDSHNPGYGIDIEDLSDVESKVDEYFRDNIEWIDSASLGDGMVNGDEYTYQYVSGEAPLTMTQARLNILEDGNYRLGEVMRQVEVPTEGGRVAKSTNLRRFGNIDDALGALGWN